MDAVVTNSKRFFAVLLAVALVACSGPSSDAAAPDWQTVQDYIDAQKALFDAVNESRRGVTDATERHDILKREQTNASLPAIDPAVDTALAIVRLEGAHEYSVDAAEFLIQYIPPDRPDALEATMLGIRTLVEHAGSYDGWLQIIGGVSGKFRPGVSPELDRFLEEFEQVDPNQPWLAAYARNVAARRRLDAVIAAATDQSERAVHRERGIELLAEFADGLESKELPSQKSVTGEIDPEVWIEQEARAILYKLTYLTPGGSIPNIVGRRMDGTEDNMAAYKGKTVLIDFWASWCAPCIDEFPKLVNLYDKLPKERFEILAISNDRQLEDALRFQDKYPMSWTNWYDGMRGPISSAMAIYAIPTYLLIDKTGTIVAWEFDLTDEFQDLIRQTACASVRDSYCSPVSWQNTQDTVE